MKVSKTSIKLILIILLLALSAGTVTFADNAVTSYPAMVRELHQDSALSKDIELGLIGKSHEGRKLWVARVGITDGIPASKKTRIFVMCRQHGDEPASTEAVLRLLHSIALGQNKSLLSSLRTTVLYVIPMVNPDGATADTRENGAGADLNRDWGVFSQPETRAVANAVKKLRPNIIVDAHNWDSTDNYDSNCIEVERDQSTPLVDAALTLQTVSVNHLRGDGYTVSATSYNAAAVPDLAHRYFMRMGIISCLVETCSGSPKNTTDFIRRQNLYIALVTSLIRQYKNQAANLDRIEHYGSVPVLEASIFSRTIQPQVDRVTTPIEPPARWPWVLAAYLFAFFALWLGRSASRLNQWSGNEREPTPEFVPASGKRSIGRHGTRWYQY